MIFSCGIFFKSGFVVPQFFNFNFHHNSFSLCYPKTVLLQQTYGAAKVPLPKKDQICSDLPDFPPKRPYFPQKGQILKGGEMGSSE
jgi:hypothetical protein